MTFQLPAGTSNTGLPSVAIRTNHRCFTSNSAVASLTNLTSGNQGSSLQ